MARKNLFIIFVALILTLAFSSRVVALYLWVDEKGQTHITDQPRPANSQGKEPSDSETTGKATLPDSHGQSSDAGRTPAPGVQPKSTTAPDATVVPPRNEPVPAPTAPVREAARNIPSEVPRDAAPDKTGVAAAITAFSSMILFGLVIGYLYFCLCLFLIAQKLDVPAAWVAWIPIVQVWTFLRAAGKPCWWVLLLLIPVVNLIIQVYLWMCIVENIGREKWLGLLMLVPIVNVVYLGMLAFSGSDSSNRTAAAA